MWLPDWKLLFRPNKNSQNVIFQVCMWRFWQQSMNQNVTLSNMGVFLLCEHSSKLAMTSNADSSVGSALINTDYSELSTLTRKLLVVVFTFLLQLIINPILFSHILWLPHTVVKIGTRKNGWLHMSVNCPGLHWCTCDVSLCNSGLYSAGCIQVIVLYKSKVPKCLCHFAATTLLFVEEFNNCCLKSGSGWISV